MDQWLHLSTIGLSSAHGVVEILSRREAKWIFFRKGVVPRPINGILAAWKKSTCFFFAAFAPAAVGATCDVTSTSQGSGYVHGSRVVSRHNPWHTSQETKPQNRRLSAENSAPGLPSFGPWSYQPTETKKIRIAKFQKVREQLMLFVFIVVYHIDIRIYSVIWSDLCMPIYLLVLSALPCPPLENQRLPAHRVAGMESWEFAVSWLILLLITFSNESKQE